MQINNTQNRNYSTHSRPGFEALKKVSYSRYFRPEWKFEDAKVVKAFSESRAFKKFTDIFDVSVRFDNRYAETLQGSSLNLNLKYKEIKHKEKNIFKRLASLFVKNGNDNSYSIDIRTTGWDRREKLQKEIEMTSFETLMIKHKKNLEEADKECNKIQEWKAIMQEIKTNLDIMKNKNR